MVEILKKILVVFDNQLAFINKKRAGSTLLGIEDQLLSLPKEQTLLNIEHIRK